MKGDKAHSQVRVSSDAFRANYDRIFRKEVEWPVSKAIWRTDIDCPECSRNDVPKGMVYEDSFGVCCAVCSWHDNYKVKV